MIRAHAGLPCSWWEPSQGRELPSSSSEWILLFCSSPHQFSFEFPVWSFCLMQRELSRHLFKKEIKVFVSCSLREARAQVQMGKYRAYEIDLKPITGKVGTCTRLWKSCSSVAEFGLAFRAHSYLPTYSYCSLSTGPENFVSPRAAMDLVFINRQQFLGGVQFLLILCCFVLIWKYNLSIPLFIAIS